MPSPALAIDPPRRQVLQGTVAQDGPAPGPCRPAAGADPAVAAGARRARGSPGASSMSPRWRPGWARRRSGSTAAWPAARKILVFRRVGRKIVAEVENQPLPRHRRHRRPSRPGVRDSFAYSTLWMGDIAAETRRRPAARRRRLLPHPRRDRHRPGAQGRRRRRVPPRRRAQRRRSQFGPRLPAAISSSRAG